MLRTQTVPRSAPAGPGVIGDLPALGAIDWTTSACAEVGEAGIAVGRLGGVDRLHDVRREHPAAVGEGAVADGQLQRRGGHQALADGHLQEVAGLQVRASRPRPARRARARSSFSSLVGTRPSNSNGRSMPGVGAEAEQPHVVLQLRAGRVVELLAQLVEERVAGHGQRGGHVDRAVPARLADGRAGRVAEHAAHAPGAHVVLDRGQLVRALVVVRRLRPEAPGGQGGVGRERLERRAHVVLALDRPVGQRRQVGIERRPALDLRGGRSGRTWRCRRRR